jgi:RNA polymerase sigma-70 factor (ECF subfamily)
MMQAQTWIGSRPERPARGDVFQKRDPAPCALEEELLPAIHKKVFGLCLGFIGNAADALDLTQDTLTRALAHRRQDNPEFVQAWIMRIARNLCFDHLRRRKARGPQHAISDNSAIEWQTPEALANSREDCRIVRQAIAQLPSRLRNVLVMREYRELSYLEISRLLHIGRGTVTSRLNRARQAVLCHYQEEQRMRETADRSKP